MQTLYVFTIDILFKNTFFIAVTRVFMLTRNATDAINIRVIEDSMFQSSPPAPNPWKLRKMSK